MAATTPMFFGTDADLRKALRLSALSSGSDSEDQYFGAVRSARLTFWRRLGSSRLTALMALTPAAPPTPPATTDELTRDLAERTEVLVCRRHLLEVWSAQFKDGGGDFLQSWNQEAAFRNLSPFEIQKRLKQLDDEIEQAFQVLEGEETPGSETTIEGTTFEREDAETRGPVTLGESVYGPGGIFVRRGS